ncbi:MAG: GNAT family N-acetyltransferase [Planctomycetes bacterium]|nr:GNAT family N-acetyltransferase [Planctomycetota bacterium]
MSVRAATEADIPAIARLHVDTWRSAYRGIVDDAYLASLSYAEFEKGRRERFDTSGVRTFVAEEAGEVAGFATAGPNRELDARYDSELYAIYVRAASARHGLGRQLVHACAAWLAAERRVGMQVWVLRDNPPACRFYEKLGGVPAGFKVVRFGQQDLAHLGYGWPDIAALAERVAP